MRFFVLFSRPNDTIEDQPPLGPIRLGPFEEFIHLTYSELRVGPKGDFLAWLDRDSVWRVRGDKSATDPEHWYSDIVIVDEETT